MSWSQLIPSSKAVATAHPVAVAPSLLAADFSKLADEVAAVEDCGVEFLHLDVMDGHFVPNITFGPFIVDAIRRCSKVALDTHLMIETPDKYIPQFIDAGSDIVTIHVEASHDVSRDLKEIRDRGAKAGLAFNPDCDFERVEPYLDQLDLLLAMTVFPGFGGQSFIADVMSRVEAAANVREQRGLDFAIEVDGGIKPETAPVAVNAGVDILVAGTAIFGKEDYAAAVAAIRG